MPIDSAFLRDFIQVVSDTTQNEITYDDLHIDIVDALNAGESDYPKLVRSLQKNFELDTPEYQPEIHDILEDDSIETLYQLAERIHDVIELG